MEDATSTSTPITRREAIGAIALAANSGRLRAAPPAPAFRLAVFTADVTPPIGHPCMGGGVAPVKEVLDPLLARGVVLLGPDKPLVIVAIDWCEVRNDAYDRWRDALAEVAGTDPARVLFSAIHQHDAPIADLEAQRLLEAGGHEGRICDLAFHERAVRDVARAVQRSITAARPVTRLGLGQARVENVASNRRYLNDDGTPAHGRTSATRDPAIRARPEGTIDPWLKTLSFWGDNGPALAALSFYATHPMSYYGQGGCSSDFVGLARRRREDETPGVLQVYVSGCSGNVTAGKYNDGSPENRDILAGRIQRAMKAAWDNTRFVPLERADFRSVPLRLEPRETDGFTVADLQRRLANDPRPFGQCLAALGLSWRKRADAGRAIELPVIDFGPALYVLLPGESYVEFQLLAQRLRPDAFVVVAGYGECATGYVPIERAFDENDSNLRDWCWVARGSEAAVTRALDAVLKPRP